MMSTIMSSDDERIVDQWDGIILDGILHRRRRKDYDNVDTCHLFQEIDKSCFQHIQCDRSGCEASEPRYICAWCIARYYCSKECRSRDECHPCTIARTVFTKQTEDVRVAEGSVERSASSGSSIVQAGESSTQIARAAETAVHHAECTNRREYTNGSTLSGIGGSEATVTKGCESIHAADNNSVGSVCVNGGCTEEVTRDADVMESVARLVESNETSNRLNNSTEEAAARDGVVCIAREFMEEASASNNSIDGVGDGTKDAAKAANTEEGTICIICSAESLINPYVVKKCGHMYCTTCLIRWQLKSKNDRIPVTCPLCGDVEMDDVESELLGKAESLLTQAEDPATSETRAEELRQDALRYVDIVLSARDVSMSAYRLKSRILTHQNRFQDLIDFIDVILEENERRMNHPVYMQWCQVQAAKNGTERARRIELFSKEKEEHSSSYEHSVISDKGVIECNFTKSWALENLGNYTEAKELYVQAVRPLANGTSSFYEKSRYIAAMVGVARCEYNVGRFSEAIGICDDLTGRWSARKYPGVYKYKALALEKQGKLDDAISVMAQAVLYETPWSDDEAYNADIRELYNNLLAKKSGNSAKESEITVKAFTHWYTPRYAA